MISFKNLVQHCVEMGFLAKLAQFDISVDEKVLRMCKRKDF